jgi:hypothetical protein
MKTLLAGLTTTVLMTAACNQLGFNKSSDDKDKGPSFPAAPNAGALAPGFKNTEIFKRWN